MDWNRFNNFDQNRFTILFNNYLTFREPLKLICRRFLFHLSIINDIERKEENIIFYKFNHLSYENDDDKNKSKSILSKWNDLYGKEWKTCENELYKLQKDYGKSIQSSFLSLLEVKDKLKLKKFLDDFHFLLDIHLRVGEKESSKQINRLINSYKNCFDKNKKKNEKCHLENFVKYICEKPLLISVDIDVMVENLLILEKKKYEESLINFLTKMMSYPHFFNKCAWENIMRIGENWIKSNHDISINNSTNESINNSTIRINRNKTSKFLFNDEKLSNFLLVSLKSLSNIFLKNFDIEKNLGELTSLIGDDIISNFCAMAIENLTGIPFLMESIERKINFDIKQLKKMRSDGNFLYFHSNSSFTDYSFDVWNSKQIKYLLKGLDTFLSNKQFIPLIIYVTDLILFRISRLVYISINQIVDDEIKLDYNLFIHDIIVLYYIIKRFPLIIFLYSKSELFEFVELEGEENENKKKLNDCFSSSYILQLIYFIFYNLFNENVEEKFPFIPSQIDSTSNHNNNLISFIYHVEKTNVEDDVGRNNVEKKYSIRQPKWKTNISYNFSISKKSNEHVSNFHQKFLIVRYSTKIISYLTCQFTELINRYDADDTTLLEDFECDIFSPIQYSDDDDYFYNLIATLNEMNKNISKIFQFSLINKFNFVYLMEEELMKERYIFELQHIQLTSCHHIEKQTTSRTTPNFLLTLINYLFIEDPSTEKYNEFTSIQEKKFNEIVKKFSKKNILNSHNCIYKELSILFIYFILFFETESKFIKIIKHCHSRFVHLNHQNRYDESKNVNIYNALPFMFWLLAIVFRHHLTSVNDLVIYSFLKKRYQRLLKILIDVTEDVVDLKILFEQLELCHPIYPNEIEGNNVEDIDMFTNVQRFDGMFEIMNVIVQKKKDEKKKNEQIIKQFHIDEIFFELDRESSNRSLYIPSKYQLFEDE
ncbi:hypothetical protein SNEBB_010080 [Seison nebaliae]|nr:hypothetical protein SNEBB_010080 [Seison nebaliae]